MAEPTINKRFNDCLPKSALLDEKKRGAKKANKELCDYFRRCTPGIVAAFHNHPAGDSEGAIADIHRLLMHSGMDKLLLKYVKFGAGADKSKQVWWTALGAIQEKFTYMFENEPDELDELLGYRDMMCSMCHHALELVGYDIPGSPQYHNYGTNEHPLCVRCLEETTPAWACNCDEKYYHSRHEKECAECGTSIDGHMCQEVPIRDYIRLSPQFIRPE